MATVIKLKRGTTTPTTSNIVSGEIAVDTSAQKLYINDASTIKTIGLGNPSVSDISDLTATATELNYLDGVTGITLGTANELLIVGSDGTSITSDSTLSIDTGSNYIGINQSSPEVTLHMTGEGAQTAQIRMEQYNDSADAPDVRTRRYRGTIASPSAVQSGDYLFRSNHEYWNGTSLLVGGAFAFDNTNNAARTQFSVAVDTDGTGANPQGNNGQFKIDGNDSGAITFNNAYKFPTSDGSANQFLQTNGSGALSFASATVSDISDLTATAAELNILDGVTATTTELNYTDGVTSNIQTQLDAKAPTAGPTFTGIATSSGGLAAQGTSLPASGAGVEINFGLVAGEGTVQAFDRSGSAWEQLRLRGSQVAFDISGTEKVRIDSSGNVGIGDSTPSYKLDVTGDINYTGTLYNNGVASGSPAQVLIKDASGTTIRTRVGLAATDGTSESVKNSAGTALKTLTGPFASSDSELVLDADPNAAILTNKTIDLSNNTLTGTVAQFNTALSDGTFKISGSYSTGEVIEELHAVCNKTDLHGRATIENVTSAQTLSTTYADATGSVVTSYTPPSGTTMIVYEYTSHLRWEDAHAISHWKLYYQVSGGTWTEVEKARTNRNGYYPEDKQILRWVFEVGADSDDSTLGIFNAATPQLGFKWQVRDYSTGNERGLLHQTVYWDGAGSAQYSQPMIMIKAIA